MTTEAAAHDTTLLNNHRIFDDARRVSGHIEPTDFTLTDVQPATAAIAAKQIRRFICPLRRP
jgi:hypothetical protein